MVIERVPTLHIVGDSISMHYGLALEQMLAGVAAYSRKPAQPGDPESANGRDSDTVVAYLRSRLWEPRCGPDYLMVNCGLHDIKRDLITGAIQTPLDRYTASLAAIIRCAAEIGAALIWVRTTPVVDAIHNRYPGMTFHRQAADVTSYNAAADAVMAAAGVPIIDLFTFTRNLGPEVYCDHVHFTEPVRTLQAAFIAGHLSHITTRSHHAI